MKGFTGCNKGFSGNNKCFRICNIFFSFSRDKGEAGHRRERIKTGDFVVYFVDFMNLNH